MTPEEIPQELVDMLNEDAGKQHKRTGVAIASLARILTRYEELRNAEFLAALAEIRELWGRTER